MNNYYSRVCDNFWAEGLCKLRKENEDIQAHLSSALSQSAAYREALEKIVSRTTSVGELARQITIIKVYHVAKKALDRGPEPSS